MARQPPGSDRAVVRQLAFVRGLHRRHRAGFRRGDINQLPGARFLAAGNIEVVANQKQERLLPGKRMGAEHRVAIAQRRGLLDELNAIDVRSGGGGKRTLSPGAITRPISSMPACRTSSSRMVRADLDWPSRSTSDCSGRRRWSRPAAVMTALRIFTGEKHKKQMTALQVKSNRSNGTVWWGEATDEPILACQSEVTAAARTLAPPNCTLLHVATTTHDLIISYHHIKIR